MKNILLAFFLSAGLVAAQDTTIQVDSSGAGGAGGGHVIEDEDVPLTARDALNFAGGGVVCADDTTKTTCTISGAAADPLQLSNGSSVAPSYSFSSDTDSGCFYLPGDLSFNCSSGDTNPKSVLYLAGDGSDAELLFLDA